MFRRRRNGLPPLVASSSWLKPGLFTLGALVVVAFVIYTHVVIRTLRRDAQRVATLYAEKILPRALGDPTISGPELRVLFDLIQQMPVAVVVTDQDGVPRSWKGITVPDTARSAEALAQVARIAAEMDRITPPREVVVPLGNGTELRWTIHVAESVFLRRVAWMPVVATVVVLLFAGVALWGFWQIKSGEQQALWVGMAKETAHQLGTPLSSLSGWLELLKEESGGRRRSDMVVREMTRDLERLRKIAQRFGQIGASPELQPQPIIPIIEETIAYMHTRMPRLGRDVAIERNYRADETILLSRELLGWAFENLLKNALDALSRTNDHPFIRVTTERDGRWLRVRIEDNGKGIPPRDLRKIFLPGYTTKKRGWGLGLTFVKRIVEEYHGGHINAYSSGQGTTIELLFPLKQ